MAAFVGGLRRLLDRLLWLEPFWVVALAIPLTLPDRILPLSWHVYLLLALFLFWPLRCFNAWWASEIGQQSNCTVYSPITVPLLALLLWTLVNLWMSPIGTASLIATGYLLLGVALYSAVIHWPPARRCYWVGAGLLLTCGVGLALVALPFVNWKPEFRLFHLPLYNLLSMLRIDVGETIHANVLAGPLVLTAPILLALALVQWPFVQAPLGLSDTNSKRAGLSSDSLFAPVAWALTTTLALVWVVAMLVLTQSRGGYLALAAAFGLVALIRWPRLWWFAPLVFLALLWFVNSIGLPTIINRLSTDGALGGGDGRLAVWTQALAALRDFPYTGIGLGAFPIVMGRLYPLQVSVSDYPHAHNLLLQVGVDLGIPGVVAYTALIINTIRMAFVAMRHWPRGSLPWGLAVGSLVSMVAILVHGLLDTVVWDTKLAFVPWLLFALITQLFLSSVADSVDKG